MFPFEKKKSVYQECTNWSPWREKQGSQQRHPLICHSYIILNLKYGTLIVPLRQHLDHGSQILASVSLPFQFIIGQMDATICFC